MEPTYQDNSVKDSDQAEAPEQDYLIYDERAEISLPEAITWASSLPYGVTLYIYDLGQGINVVGNISDLIKAQKEKE